jgi:Uma2 family endonuclease
MPSNLTLRNTGAGIASADMAANRALIPGILVTRADAGTAGELVIHPSDVVLVVEVVSPSTLRADHHDKREIYAAWGIDHYWIVDQAPDQVTVLQRDGDHYVQTQDATAQVDVTQPYAVHIDLSEIR